MTDYVFWKLKGDLDYIYTDIILILYSTLLCFNHCHQFSFSAFEAPSHTVNGFEEALISSLCFTANKQR